MTGGGTGRPHNPPARTPSTPRSAAPTQQHGTSLGTEARARCDGTIACSLVCGEGQLRKHWAAKARARRGHLCIRGQQVPRVQRQHNSPRAEEGHGLPANTRPWPAEPHLVELDSSREVRDAKGDEAHAWFHGQLTEALKSYKSISCPIPCPGCFV